MADWSEGFANPRLPTLDDVKAALGIARQMTEAPKPVEDVDRAIGQYRGGDYLGALESMYGATPMTGAIKAYHGSPHSFDRFDMSKIGTGEGAQSYGHGLYFAESEPVARSYRDALASSSATINGVPVRDLAAQKYRLGIKESPTAEQNIADYISSYQDNARFMMEKRNPELVPLYDELKRNGAINDQGHMYEVRINAEPHEFLDWDKALSEHPEPIKNVLSGKMGLNETPASSLGRAYKNQMFAGDIVGQNTASPSDLSLALNKMGIPGIKYLDQGSRGSGEGSRNYVVFNDKLIDILRKYGIGGAVAPLAALGLKSQSQQDQGM